MPQTNLFMFSQDENHNKKEEFINHKYLKENSIIAKKYQIEIAKNCLYKNTAVILPTGLGKTVIAFLVIVDTLPKKILFLAPTKPLVMQHHQNCKKFLNIPEYEIIMLSGSISAKKRANIFRQGTIIISTPQTIKNDLANNLYNLSQIGLIIFDEMHKAVENYAYVEIAKRFNGLILGLTASPGSRKKKIKQIMTNLNIDNIESRVREDSDVREYVKEISIEWIKVPMNQALREIQKPLNELFLERLCRLNKLGILTYKPPKYISVKDILGARMSIMRRFGRSPYAFASYTNQAVLLQTYHCLELIESQGSESFLMFIEKFKEKKKLSGSERIFINDTRLKRAIALAKEKQDISHPKLEVLRLIVEKQLREEPDSLILVFTQYRNTIESIESILKNLNDVKINRFIGQSSHGHLKGMSQNQQREIIDKFTKREITLLIATSVAEEGIDIPNVNLVVFYEPVPSEIRGIQRKGRTGRSHIGKVKILITEGTRDEAYLYAENRKENKMQWIVRNFRDEVYRKP